MTQYLTLPNYRLDNDEDGCVDNPLALTKYLAMKPQPAILVPGTKNLPTAVGAAFNKAGYFCNAPLYTGEILPKCSGPAATSACADATLEEVGSEKHNHFNIDFHRGIYSPSIP